MKDMHETLREQLDEYLAGALESHRAAEVEAHLLGCASCRAEVLEIEALLAEVAALPAEIAPPRDLWSGIAARIEAGSGTDAADTPAPAARDVIRLPVGEAAREARAGVRPTAAVRPRLAVRPWFSSRAVLAAAAAVLLVVLSSGITALVLRGPGGSAPVVAGGDAAPVLTPGRSLTALAAYEATEREYIGLVEELTAEFAARRATLAPETVAAVEQSLRVVEQAIAEARAALESDPNNPDLPLLLTGVYRQKVEMLQTVTSLPVAS